MTAIQCRVEIPKVEGLKDNELTVGRVFHLLCEGDFPRDLAVGKLHFVEPEGQKYLIKLLKSDFKSTTAADFTVTTYRAGDIRWPELKMTDDKETFNLGPSEYHVESILPKPDPSKQAAGTEAKVEPYGPIGPATLSVPHIYWIMLLAAIGLIVGLIVFKILRVIQRRNMIERLKEHDSALTPITQFHQSMRKLQRVNPAFFGGATADSDVHGAMDEMRQMLRLFITRKYQIPAMEWSARAIVTDIKKYHRKVYTETGSDLQALIKEFQHASENKQSVTGSDVVNIAKRTRHVVETMESLS